MNRKGLVFLHEFPPCLTGIDWKLLKKQKKTLLKVIDNTDNIPVLEHLEGIVCLLNAIQDYAVDVMGISERKVFPKSK